VESNSTAYWFATAAIFLYMMSRAIDSSPLEAEKRRRRNLVTFFFFHIQIDK